MDPKQAARAHYELQARRLAEVAALVQYIKFVKKLGMRPGWNHLLLKPMIYRDENSV